MSEDARSLPERLLRVVLRALEEEERLRTSLGGSGGQRRRVRLLGMIRSVVTDWSNGTASAREAAEALERVLDDPTDTHASDAEDPDVP